MYRKYQLSHKEAQAMIQAMQEDLEHDGQTASIAITDAHGELLAFLRMDGCKLPPINIAINKAFTAAREGKESKEIGEAALTYGFPITNYGDLRYTGWPGGTPIVFEGEIIGAIGISGTSSDAEVNLGQMAAQLISTIHKRG